MIHPKALMHAWALTIAAALFCHVAGQASLESKPTEAVPAPAPIPVSAVATTSDAKVPKKLQPLIDTMTTTSESNTSASLNLPSLITHKLLFANNKLNISDNKIYLAPQASTWLAKQLADKMMSEPQMLDAALLPAETSMGVDEKVTPATAASTSPAKATSDLGIGFSLHRQGTLHDLNMAKEVEPQAAKPPPSEAVSMEDFLPSYV